MNKIPFTQTRNILRVTGSIIVLLGLMMGLIAASPARNAAAPLGQTIWLRANANNLYVSADQNLANVQLVANRTSPGGAGSWEQFAVVDAGGGLIALRASNGKYVSADTNIAAYAPLIANRTTIQAWEKFTWTDVGAGQVTLKASTNAKFVSTDLNRAAYLVADRATAGGWETFTWGVGTAPQPTPTPGSGGWNLVWSDEFNGTSVNTSNWNFMTGCSGWGNGEWEDYTNGANATVQNGTLVIEARMKPGAALGNCGMTSTRMNSQGKRSFQYGRIEARLQIPMGQGLWPAFWMMGNGGGTWPANGEIDIMEHISNENRTHGYIHWSNASNAHEQTGGSIVNNSPTAFHVYSIEWDASAIKWFLDGTQFASANIQGGTNGTSEFHQPHYFLLNLAVGGGWPGYPTSTNIMPARYILDYVRVYQH